MMYNWAWASHLPILIKVLNMTDGPVLELGTGFFSTPVMHWLCLDKNRVLISYENDERYFSRSKSFMKGLHEIKKIDRWEDADIENTHWSVVLVDHQPDLRRKDDIKRIANNADYIIVHDTQAKHNKLYGYIEETFPLFKYRYDYTKGNGPQTSVLSNFKDLSNL